jgi:hypothetical protein
MRVTSEVTWGSHMSIAERASVLLDQLLIEETERARTRYAVRFLSTVREIPRSTWEQIFPANPECWDFYRLSEAVTPPGFNLSVIAAFDGIQIVAAVLVFTLDYRLDTPIQGPARLVGDWLHARWPRAISRTVMGLGSPMSDSFSFGLAPRLTPTERQQAVSELLDCLRMRAKLDRTSVLAIKSLGDQAAEFDTCIARAGYHRVTNLPIVALPTKFNSFDDYLQGLPKKTRGYLRRKMRPLSELRIDIRSSATGLESQLFAMFEDTRRQSKGSYGEFDGLHPEVFDRMLRGLGDQSSVMLCWRGDELMSFLFMLTGKERIIGKYVGMQYPAARELNLYFIMALKMIELAIERRASVVEMGVTTYATKLLFGGHLERRWLYFRFMSPLQHAIISPLAFLFDFERNDAELRRLDAGGSARCMAHPGVPGNVIPAPPAGAYRRA